MFPRWYSPYKRSMRRMRRDIWWEGSALPTVIAVAVILLTIAGLMARH